MDHDVQVKRLDLLGIEAVQLLELDILVAGDGIEVLHFSLDEVLHLGIVNGGEVLVTERAKEKVMVAGIVDEEFLYTFVRILQVCAALIRNVPVGPEIHLRSGLGTARSAAGSTATGIASTTMRVIWSNTGAAARKHHGSYRQP